jgi:uncharacterized pyridoxal phosphate-containing UPF0001 family protein
MISIAIECGANSVRIGSAIFGVEIINFGIKF